MPVLTPPEQVSRHISTLKKAEILAFPTTAGRHPFPMVDLIRQVVSDRLALAGNHLSTGDALVLDQHFRSAISRHYYAMYHSARAIAFGAYHGDDFEKHYILPRNLPPALPDATRWQIELTNARLLRNEADYDCYPAGHGAWETDSRALSATAAEFVGLCEEFSITNGYV